MPLLGQNLPIGAANSLQIILLYSARYSVFDWTKSQYSLTGEQSKTFDDHRSFIQTE